MISLSRAAAVEAGETDIEAAGFVGRVEALRTVFSIDGLIWPRGLEIQLCVRAVHDGKPGLEESRRRLNDNKQPYGGFGLAARCQVLKKSGESLCQSGQ